MVTAILPSLTDETGPAAEHVRKPSQLGRPSVALSVDSEVTITPERFRTSAGYTPSGEATPISGPQGKGKPSVLAGYVGLFTGCGALVALSLFLPLPARFGRIEGVTMADAVRYSFYVVGAVSFLVAIFVFFGLRGIRGEEGKGWRMLLGLRGSTPQGAGSESSPAPKNVRIL
jgi:hypothetical protein